MRGLRLWRFYQQVRRKVCNVPKPSLVDLYRVVPGSSLRQCSPLTQRLYQSKRHHSTHSIGSIKLRPITSNIGKQALGAQRRTIAAGQTSYNVLAHMERTANNNPSSATSQNAFYSALLRANRPDLVVQRYETQGFAFNTATEQMYNRALNQLAATLPQTEDGSSANMQQAGAVPPEHIQAIAQALGSKSRGANGAIVRSVPGRSAAGQRSDPLYVVVEESIGGSIFKWVKFFLWFAFAGWIFYVILTMAVEAGGMLKRAGGHTHAEAKPELQKTRFSEVHGCDEAKEELQELVDFLKAPEKFSTLGGKLPKGVLLVGPPGTGKTLLARAVAGEAGVPFFYMSGSEFDEVYVGVGAKRVRELFAAARSKAPAIVFIDELDAIGAKRNERDAAYVKQTLNQLLTDLDGFDQDSGVIFLAATNFPELLDKALTRPGRFDRRVVVPLPDVRGRVAILKHHTKAMQIGTDVDESVLARGTPGFSGAELENLANQAAVHASKRKATKIEMQDFEWAKDKILMGAERRSAVIQQKDKIMTAYHEGGHALIAMLTPGTDPLYKATIMPRGHALGITYQLPELDKVSMAKREYLAQIDVCMGGKVAEELIYGPDDVTSGASSDIQKATSIAYAMVTQMGMSDRLGNLDLHSDYARLPPETKQTIWEEVRGIVDASRNRAHTLLTTHRKELELLAAALVDYETLSKGEMEQVVKGEKLDRMMASPDAPIKIPDVPVPGRIPTPPGIQGPGDKPEPIGGPPGVTASS